MHEMHYIHTLSLDELLLLLYASIYNTNMDTYDAQRWSLKLNILKYVVAKASGII